MAPSLLWFLFIASVESVRVVEIGGNLILKGITNWREIKKYYKENNDDSVGAERNDYDGGDIVVYPEKGGDFVRVSQQHATYITHKHTLIFFKDQGNVPYEYRHQNPKDCSFEFKQAADECARGHFKIPCFRWPKSLTMSAADLQKKVKDGQVGFLPYGTKEPQPKWAIAGIWIAPKKTITNTPILHVVGFDGAKSEGAVGNKGIAVSHLLIHEDGKWLFYEYEGREGENGLAFHENENKEKRKVFKYNDLIRKCDAGQVFGANQLRSYVGDYGLKSEDKCGAASAYDEYDNEYEQVYDEMDRDDAFIRGFYEGYRASERLRKRHKLQSELKYRLDR